MKILSRTRTAADMAALRGPPCAQPADWSKNCTPHGLPVAWCMPPGLDIGAAGQKVEFVGSRRVPFVVQTEQDRMLRYHVSSLTHCLNDGLDLCSEYQVGRLPLDVWPRVKATDRLGVLQQLKTWVLEGTTGQGQVRRPSDPEHPVAGGVRALFGASEPLGPPRVFQRRWCQIAACSGAKTWRSSATLQQVCDMKANSRRRRNGRAKPVSSDHI